MARTAEYVVKKVLDMLVVGASEASLPAADAQNVIDYMNDYMSSIEAQGIVLGYTEVTNLADTVTVPAGAIRGVIANVAITVAPSYDVPISQGLAFQAKSGFRAMLRLSNLLEPTKYPSTLPRGSGNSQENGLINNRFYPGITTTT